MSITTMFIQLSITTMFIQLSEFIAPAHGQPALAKHCIARKWFTLLYRLLLLRKLPTLLKFLCAGAVLFGLLFSLIPVFSGLDQDSKTGNEAYLSQPRLGQIFWPLCFMFGFVSGMESAVMKLYKALGAIQTIDFCLAIIGFWSDTKVTVPILIFS
jgi:hypothetical protein